MAKKITHICSNCGFQGKTKKVTRGSIEIELVLWLLLILPGVIYSIWRMTTKTEVCPKCKTPNMLPIDTPKGKDLAQVQLSNK